MNKMAPQRTGSTNGSARLCSLRRAVLAAVAGLALAAGPAAAADEGKAAMLFPGSINDQSWNAVGYQGLVKLKAAGWDTAYSENVQSADEVEALRDYAKRGFDLVIGHTGRFLSAAERVGGEFPKTTFIVGSGSGGAGKNVASVDFDNTQFGYLMGVLAAKLSKTGKIGSVNGLEGLPNVYSQIGAYRQGARSVNPKIEVKVIYIKDMEDAAAAKEAALSLADWGADFISGKLNAAQAGIIQAAKERNIYCNGRSTDQTAIAPTNVATNIVEKWDEMYAAAAVEAKAGKLGGKYELYGLDTPGSTGASLKYSPDSAFNPAIPPAIVADVEALEKTFAAGGLKIKVVKEDGHGGL
ncbi:BMP family protein [Methylocapsa sp. S129]|uniref:BMP family protein n=1 Tax=Methylocapsa sp. S129 TaxID=1641869 RepID=UPI00131C86B3|nr:BMP family protein [Methylocapsa sp. S129]